MAFLFPPHPNPLPLGERDSEGTEEWIDGSYFQWIQPSGEIHIGNYVGLSVIGFN